MDLHAPQIQGFFHVPVDNLYALPVLCERIRAKKLESPIVVSPDTGFAKRARNYASYLGASIAIADKERVGHIEQAEVLQIIGHVKGKTAVLVDDFAISGATLTEVATELIERGAIDVYAMVTHGVLATGAMERIDASPIKQLFITDTIETQPVQLSHKVEAVSVAPLFAEAIKRIHNRESISVMFPG
jgi:ribose-phosphate pyrophosphokinase